VSSSTAGLYALTDLGLNMSLATKEHLIIGLNLTRLFFCSFGAICFRTAIALDTSVDFLTPSEINTQCGLLEIWNLSEKRAAYVLRVEE